MEAEEESAVFPGPTLALWRETKLQQNHKIMGINKPDIKKNTNMNDETCCYFVSPFSAFHLKLLSQLLVTILSIWLHRNIKVFSLLLGEHLKPKPQNKIGNVR